MCDTFGAQASWCGNGQAIFGKNSDREPDEAQLITTVPRAIHPPGDMLACTYITIPQARSTNACLLSRPFWMWGAEMGVNKKGLIIGNEALFTRQKPEKSPGLIGMDLLRLALERAATAAEAVDVITSLLQQYGQGGACGYRDKRLAYMNAFLIMDRREVIVLETVGRDYACRSFEDYAAISNTPSLGDDWDQASLAPGTDMRRLRDPLMSYFAGGGFRSGHTRGMLAGLKGRMDLAQAFALLRSHHAAQPGRGFNRDVCMHFADPIIRRSQTTASLVVALEDAGGLRIFVTGGSGPCLSAFKPLLPKALPAGSSTGGAAYRADSLWWRHAAYHLNTELRYEALIGDIAPAIREREERFCLPVSFYDWETQDPALVTLSQQAFGAAHAFEQGILARCRDLRPTAGALTRYHWQRVARRNGIPLF